LERRRSMKLATYSPKTAQSPQTRIGAAIGADTLVDLNYAYARYLSDVENEVRAYELAWARIPPDMIGFLQGGPKAISAAERTLGFVQEKGLRTVKGLSGEQLVYALGDVKLHAPIPRPGKILAAGKNYAKHVQEGAKAKGVAAELPPFPRGFVKVSSVVIGPDEPVEIAHVTERLDYEVELAVVIGKRGRYIEKERAYEYIAGYTILNDVSARDIQMAESKYGNHMLGKNLDTLSPMGPWLVLKDEVEDPMNLRIQLRVNGKVRQDANTGDMIHGIPAIMERWSWVTLEPGDVIATGTPEGVALGGDAGSYLRQGDVMECTIEKVGTLRNPVVAERVAYSIKR
jgi:acylpyruvate hydrolase